MVLTEILLFAATAPALSGNVHSDMGLDTTILCLLLGARRFGRFAVILVRMFTTPCGQS